MLQGELTMILDEVNLVADVAKELKNDLKGMSAELRLSWKMSRHELKKTLELTKEK